MQKLNGFTVALLASLSLLASAPGAWSDDDMSILPVDQEAIDQVKADFWSQVQDLVLRCAVMPYGLSADGQKIYGTLRSTCEELKITQTTPTPSATFVINKREYLAQLVDNDHSDGGDLGDVSIFTADTHQLVATRTAVPAFGDVLQALAGGTLAFREIHDESLDVRN